MADWSERVDQLLFDGEHVESTVDLAGGTVVVTGQRVLVFTPGGDGEQFRALDRPNVLGVERRGVSPFDLVSTAAKLGVAGVLLVGIGLVLDPEALIPRPDLSAAQGTGGMLGMVETMLNLFYALDVVALALGAFLSILGAALIGIQIATREERLAVEVAGDEDVLLSHCVDEPTIADLETALEIPDAQGNPHQRPTA